MAKETKARKGKSEYYRKTLRHPVTGERRDVYGKTKQERDDKAADLQAAWAREIELQDSPYLFQYAADWFSRISVDMTPRRRAEIAREINNNICPRLGQKRLVEISSDDVKDMMAARTARSKSARQRTLQTFNRILDSAVDAGKIPRNPGRARTVSAGGERTAPKTALTKPQEQTLLQVIRGHRVELFCRLALYAGLRREEITGLQWQDVHLEGETPYLDVRHVCRWENNNRAVLDDIGKSDAAWRSIGIPPALLPWLQEAKAAAEKEAGDRPLSGRTVLTTETKQPWSYQTFRRVWKVIEARTAGMRKIKRKDPTTGKMVTVTVERRLGDTVPHHPDVVISLDFDVTPHKLRRTYITRLILGGADPRRVQYLAGHASPQVTLQYYTDLQDHQPEDLIGLVREIFPG
ncbi:MAG: tyrosine-type recombinase/integrase [Oscillospiraceae bacterium]|nr:tyrosine-type recombinase/integrase [Oscillospiraceae bacterium]MBQ2633435.1 tyrosine-type recombinase/integrase [Oscillospiraceae bacterium]